MYIGSVKSEVGFFATTFSRYAKASKLALVIWLNENVSILGSESGDGVALTKYTIIGVDSM